MAGRARPLLLVHVEERLIPGKISLTPTRNIPLLLVLQPDRLRTPLLWLLLRQSHPNLVIVHAILLEILHKIEHDFKKV